MPRKTVFMCPFGRQLTTEARVRCANRTSDFFYNNSCPAWEKLPKWVSPDVSRRQHIQGRRCRVKRAGFVRLTFARGCSWNSCNPLCEGRSYWSIFREVLRHKNVPISGPPCKYIDIDPWYTKQSKNSKCWAVLEARKDVGLLRGVTIFIVISVNVLMLLSFGFAITNNNIQKKAKNTWVKSVLIQEIQVPCATKIHLQEARYAYIYIGLNTRKCFYRLKYRFYVCKRTQCWNRSRNL